MDPVTDIFSPKASLAIRRLLPRLAAGIDSDPGVTYQDWLHVRHTIGTPQVLEDDLGGIALSVGDQLPPAAASLLLNTVTVYALAFDLFDTEEQTLRWWNTPISLSSTLPAAPPRNWVGVPGYSEELIARIRRTRHGIY